MRKKKNRYFCTFRSMRHAQERKAYYRSPEYVRAKRNPANLPDPWDDKYGTWQKSWKVKREKQYRGRSQLTEFHFRIDEGIYLWRLEDYLDEKDIPHRIEPIRESHEYWHQPRIWKRTDYVVAYRKKWDGENFVDDLSHPVGYKWKGEWVDYGEPYLVKCTKTVGYNVTYWHQKDIGLEYVLGALYNNGYWWN